MSIFCEKPDIRDAADMWRLAKDTGTLDTNSPYFYLTLANQLSDTCIVARSGRDLAGFIVGFRPPRAPDTLFVWQITVSDLHRRKGLAHTMLRELMASLAGDGVRFLEATVTPSNDASMRMFRTFAESYDAPCNQSELYPSDLFPDGHEAEHLLRMGPFSQDAIQQDTKEVA